MTTCSGRQPSGAPVSDAKRYGVFGVSGSGKSAYVKAHVANTERLVVFDPTDEYSRGGRGLRNLKRCTTVEQVRQQMTAKWDVFRIAYVPPTGKEPRTLNALCKLMMMGQEPFKDSGRGAKMTLVVDELNLAFPSTNGPTLCPGFADICARGRHYGIELYGITQRIREVHPRFRDNLSEAVSFTMGDADGRKAAASMVDVPVTEMNALEPLHFIARAGFTKRRGKLTFAKNRATAKVSYVT